MPQSSQFFDITYRGFQIDELHHHNQNLVGTLHATSLLWFTNMKTAVKVNPFFPRLSLEGSSKVELEGRWGDGVLFLSKILMLGLMGV